MTPKGELDTAVGSDALAGFNALASDEPAWDDGPFRVHGIALGSGDITQGVSGERVYWPDSVLSDAADAFIGRKIVSDRDHGNLEQSQPATDTIIGEITDAKHVEGQGIAYEGEIDDPDVAKQIDRGRIDVSPMLWRRLGDYDEERDAHTAQEVVKVRDLATVSEGASAGASIQPGAATALQAEALRATFADSAEPDALASFNHLSYDGTKGGKLDKSNLPSDGFKSHFLFPGDTKSDSSFPVIDGSGYLRKGNVESAWSLRGQAPSSKEDIERILVTLAGKFDDPPFTEGDADALAQTDAELAAHQRDADQDNENPEMELTDDEEALIHAARSIEDDEPTVVPAEQQALAQNADELNLNNYDDPTVLESDEYETMTERVNSVKEVFAGALAARTDMKPETADALSLDVLMAEFEDDDGELDADALAQNPEAGGAGGPEEPGTVTADALSAEQQDELESLAARAETFDGVDDEYADSLREQAAEVAGAEEWSDIEEGVV